MNTQSIGLEVSKIPLMYAKTILIGTNKTETTEESVNNGTMTLIELNCKPIGITCSHVLSEYRKRKLINNSTIFQVGNLQFDPLENIIDEDEELDIVTFDLSGFDLKKIDTVGPLRTNFIHPATWPPNDISTDDIVCFGGFPGILRESHDNNEMTSGALSLDATEVTSINEEHFICAFDRSGWIKALGDRPDSDVMLPDFGGMSGAPVFVWRELHFEFVGIIFEHSPFYDAMYVRPAKLINENGTINRTNNPLKLFKKSNNS